MCDCLSGPRFQVCFIKHLCMLTFIVFCVIYIEFIFVFMYNATLNLYFMLFLSKVFDKKAQKCPLTGRKQSKNLENELILLKSTDKSLKLRVDSEIVLYCKCVCVCVCLTRNKSK